MVFSLFFFNNLWDISKKRFDAGCFGVKFINGTYIGLDIQKKRERVE